jgi:hypothetical protein
MRLGMAWPTHPGRLWRSRWRTILVRDDTATIEADAVEKEFEDHVYAIFQRHVHPHMNPANIPSPRDAGAHQPTLVRRTEVLETPAPLRNLEQTLLGAHFADAFDRFDILCKPEA